MARPTRTYPRAEHDCGLFLPGRGMLRLLRWRSRRRRRLKNPTHRVLRARARHPRLNAHTLAPCARMEEAAVQARRIGVRATAGHSQSRSSPGAMARPAHAAKRPDSAASASSVAAAQPPRGVAHHPWMSKLRLLLVQTYVVREKSVVVIHN